MKTQFSPRSGPKAALRGCRGMTAPELLVAIGVGSLVLMIMAVVFTSSSVSFANMGNYINMDRCSRAALDRMTTKIRQAKNLTYYDSGKVVFDYDGAGTTLTYAYDSSDGTLTEVQNGNTTTLLTG